jgi:hypothetical protein
LTGRSCGGPRLELAYILEFQPVEGRVGVKGDEQGVKRGVKALKGGGRSLRLGLAYLGCGGEIQSTEGRVDVKGGQGDGQGVKGGENDLTGRRPRLGLAYIAEFEPTKSWVGAALRMSGNENGREGERSDGGELIGESSRGGEEAGGAPLVRVGGEGFDEREQGVEVLRYLR